MELCCISVSEGFNHLQFLHSLPIYPTCELLSCFLSTVFFILLFLCFSPDLLLHLIAFPLLSYQSGPGSGEGRDVGEYRLHASFSSKAHSPSWHSDVQFFYFFLRFLPVLWKRSGSDLQNALTGWFFFLMRFFKMYINNIRQR